MYNVGSIFRNCAAFGIEKLYLTGITATPPRKEIAKVALGSERLVDWEEGDIGDIILKLRSEDYAIYGLETTENAKNLHEVSDEKLAIVLGNEVDGIDAETLEKLDGSVIIPMNKKQSLNVSVASGIAMYAYTCDYHSNKK